MNTFIRRIGHSVSGNRRRFTAAAVGTLFALCTPRAASAEHIDTTLHGLPGGLTVTYVLQFSQCTSATAPVTFVSGGSVSLQEGVEYVAVPQPSSPIGIALQARAIYYGGFDTTVPQQNSCAGNGNQAGRMNYIVSGQSASGAAALRRSTPLATIFVPGVSRVFSDRLSAVTDSLTQLDGSPITTLRIGSMNRFLASYGDSFGGSAIGTPVFEIQRLSAVLGIKAFRSLVTMWITDDGRACLAAGGSSLCRTLSSGGTLVLGGVTLSVATLRLNDFVVGDSRSVQWSFTLDSSFDTAGTFRVVARANDKDSIAYLVNGQPTPLDLLPWGSASAAVNFTF